MIEICDRAVFNFYTGLSRTCIPQMRRLFTLQVSVALSFSLGDIRSAGSTEKNASFADELQIEFSTGVKQVSIKSCIAMANSLLCQVECGALTLTVLPIFYCQMP